MRLGYKILIAIVIVSAWCLLDCYKLEVVEQQANKQQKRMWELANSPLHYRDLDMSDTPTFSGLIIVDVNQAG